MISFMGVSKFILANVSIHIPKGITVGLIGETGSGKTTFLKLACGLVIPDAGEVYTLGQTPGIQKGRRIKSMDVLFAHLPLLQSEESVGGNFESRKLIYGMPEGVYQSEYKRLFKMLELEEHEQKKVQSLSLGQRRRAELAAVFLHKPKLLLLDEPTVGLDQNGKDIFHRLVQERQAQGLTTVITSHDMSDISTVCDRIAILKQGTICAYGDRSLLLKKYAPVDVMQFTLQSGVPDLEDLPVESYSVADDVWKLIYNSNHVSSPEILQTILSYCSIKEVSIRKPDLEDVIMTIKRGR